MSPVAPHGTAGDLTGSPRSKTWNPPPGHPGIAAFAIRPVSDRSEAPRARRWPQGSTLGEKFVSWTQETVWGALLAVGSEHNFEAVWCTSSDRLTGNPWMDALVVEACSLRH